MKKLTLFIIGCGLTLLGLAACGSATQEAPTVAPTFTTIPTYSFDQPTAAASVATAAAATQAAGANSGLDPQAVERGRGRYEALDCASCHGDNGEGTDKGSSLITYTADETTFISFMRSGGALGSDHQYSTNRLSESGGKNLYQYLLSLRTS
ncbi:MAG: cytochrome c [Anaerolineae bacterium]